MEDLQKLGEILNAVSSPPDPKDVKELTAFYEESVIHTNGAPEISALPMEVFLHAGEAGAAFFDALVTSRNFPREVIKTELAKRPFQSWSPQARTSAARALRTLANERDLPESMRLLFLDDRARRGDAAALAELKAMATLGSTPYVRQEVRAMLTSLPNAK
jgi:hypothetical protein